MPSIKRFEDLRVWQESRVVCQLIRDFVKRPEFSKDFSLKDQIKRSSGSCMDNIAEGFAREGNKEFRQFLAISKGSMAETRSQLYRAFDYQYITEDELIRTAKRCDDLCRQIGSFINYLNNSSFKGNKFQEPSEPYGESEN